MLFPISAGSGPGCFVSVVFAATIVRTTPDVTEGRLVACAVMVTDFPLGIAAGAVYVAITPVWGYAGTGPLKVCDGLNVPQEVSTAPVPGEAALPQVAIQLTPRN